MHKCTYENSIEDIYKKQTCIRDLEAALAAVASHECFFPKFIKISICTPRICIVENIALNFHNKI